MKKSLADELMLEQAESSWWRNKDFRKLKLKKKLEKLYESHGQKISAGDLLERINNLAGDKTVNTDKVKIQFPDDYEL